MTQLSTGSEVSDLLCASARIGFRSRFSEDFGDTVDGRNPAPPWMVETLVIMG